MNRFNFATRSDAKKGGVVHVPACILWSRYTRTRPVEV